MITILPSPIYIILFFVSLIFFLCGLIYYINAWEEFEDELDKGIKYYKKKQGKKRKKLD